MQRPSIMQVPAEITFRDMVTSTAVESAVQRWVDRLNSAYDRIQSCKVVIERPHKGHRQGDPFHVRVELAIPDRVIVVGRDPAKDDAHTDVYVAIADAFRAARRQLRDHVRIRRGEVKAHA